MSAYIWPYHQYICIYMSLYIQGWTTLEVEAKGLYLRLHLGQSPGDLFISFWPENNMASCPTLPIHPMFPWVTFFLFPQVKKALKGKRFAHVE